ncbi:MAG: hypothetical protein QXI58_00640 [Candidatus Micrarchaeia archaeon]
MKRDILIYLAAVFDIKGHIRIVPTRSYQIRFNLGKAKYKDIQKIIQMANKLNIKFGKYINKNKNITRLETNSLLNSLKLMYFLKDFSLRKREIEEAIKDIKKIGLCLKRKRKRFERIIKEVEEEYKSLKKEIEKSY